MSNSSRKGDSFFSDKCKWWWCRYLVHFSYVKIAKKPFFPPFFQVQIVHCVCAEDGCNSGNAAGFSKLLLLLVPLVPRLLLQNWANFPLKSLKKRSGFSSFMKKVLFPFRCWTEIKPVKRQTIIVVTVLPFRRKRNNLFQCYKWKQRRDFWISCSWICLFYCFPRIWCAIQNAKTVFIVIPAKRKVLIQECI